MVFMLDYCGIQLLLFNKMYRIKIPSGWLNENWREQKSALLVTARCRQCHSQLRHH